MGEALKALASKKRARAIAQYSIEYILNFCLKGRSLIGNDFDAAIVLFTIQVYVGERAFRLNEQNCRAMGFDDPFPDDLLVPISRLAIANITGLPKETVRRKTLRLEHLGLIRRVGSRGLAISHEFAAGSERETLMHFNHKSLVRMVSQIAALSEGLDDEP
jgi:hypothetical protein